jgi:phosphoglycolate phosphatase
MVTCDGDMSGLTAIQNVLFDLDGTLVDSSETITRSLRHALGRMDRATGSGDSLRRFIGMPLYDIFVREFDLPPDQARVAIDIYREYYDRLGQAGTRVYPGINEMLTTLRSSGYRLFVATVKPTPIAERVLSDLSLRAFFEGVAGASLGPERRDKASIIGYALDRHALTGMNCLMVGDRDQDIRGARDHGLRSLGVTWGFGSREELLTAGADKLAEGSQDIATFLSGTAAPARPTG